VSIPDGNLIYYSGGLNSGIRMEKWALVFLPGCNFPIFGNTFLCHESERV
jgi:hypothetical protein